jgi:glycosyltransferase involved in cell wall biosynthesis
VNKRILIVAHGHPSVHKGGAEFAAYDLYKEYERQGIDVKFMARSAESPHGGAAFSSRKADKEILFHTTHDDFFLFSNLKSRYVWQEFRDFLKRFKPDVVHFHHYFLLGIETIMEVKNTLPDCKIVLTLHEYLAICHNKGLMIKKSDNRLCYEANPKDCHLCFPDRSPADFFMREKYIKRILQEVDHFISPSHFLKQRYEQWGLNPDGISVIENGQNSALIPITDVTEKSATRIRFAFFGQINEFKGVDLLLEAVSLVPKALRKKISVEIHGANLELQNTKFIKKVTKLLKQQSKYATFHGAYEPEDLDQLMAEIDWLVVPSIWWENSPLVIQEALNHKVPVIVSDIGGMAEKVQKGVNGLHFRAGKASSLAEVFCQVLSECQSNEIYKENIQAPLTMEQTANMTQVVYQQCR